MSAEQREADRLERAERDLDRIDLTESRADESRDDCDVCHGTGLVTITYGGDGYGDRCCGEHDADDQRCPACQPDPYTMFWLRRVKR